MHWRKISIGIVVLFLLVLSSEAQIIQTGTLSGTVQDKDKAALPGVTVTITSPALIAPQMSPGPVIGSGGYLGAAGRGLLVRAKWMASR